MTPQRILSPDEIAAMRQMYVDGVPVSQIKAKFKISTRLLYYWLAGGPADGHDHLPPIPLRAQTRTKGGEASNRAAPNGTRRTLVDRIWRTASRQVREIEDRLRARVGGNDSDDNDRERDARVLSVLVKTLRELATLDDINAGAGSAAPKPDCDNDDPVPRDIDEFRLELARRIQAFVDSESDGSVPSDTQ